MSRPKLTREMLGRVVSTRGALAELQESEQDPSQFLDRHSSGDWGEDLPKEDEGVNLEVLERRMYGAIVMSVYKTTRGITIWVITHLWQDTTLLLPEEY